MVQISEIAKLIENGLNDPSLQSKYQFSIAATNGDVKVAKQTSQTALPKPIINGVVVPMSDVLTPLKGLDMFNMSVGLRVVVQRNKANTVVDIIRSYVYKNVGGEVNIGDYAAIARFDMPYMTGIEKTGTLGEAVTIYTTGNFLFIKDGVLDNQCNFYIDGEKMLVLSASLPREKILQTDAIEQEQEMTSVANQQGLQFNLEIPYKKTPVTQQLMREILFGRLGAFHTFTYDDGIITDDNGNAPSWTVILKSGCPNYELATVPSITLTFMIGGSAVYE